MDLVTNEMLIAEICHGEVKIQLSVHENDGWSVWLTARDRHYRRIWRTPFTDEKGNIIVYVPRRPGERTRSTEKYFIRL